MWHSRACDGISLKGNGNMQLAALFLMTVSCFVVLWLISLKMQDASIVDMWWGPGFALLAVVGAFIRPHADIWGWLFLISVCIWGLRLGWHIFRRHDGEDSRYARMRAAGGADFGKRSLVSVFLLQAVVQFVAASHVLTTVFVSGVAELATVIPGLALFAIGFLLEVVADNQLQGFRANPANRGQLMRQGLYAYVRHPNYLGEFILQIGLGLAAYGLTGSLWAFLGPMLMIVIVSYVSGPPLQQESQSRKPGYEEWMESTGRFLPRIGKRSP
jgi:steroid 5-alpha reductase family enzyme